MSLVEALPWIALALFGVWFTWSVLTLSWWRAANLDRAWKYRRRMGRWCDHTQDPDDPPHWVKPEPGFAWSAWQTPVAGHWPTRWCGRCGWEQRL